MSRSTQVDETAKQDRPKRLFGGKKNQFKRKYSSLARVHTQSNIEPSAKMNVLKDKLKMQMNQTTIPKMSYLLSKKPIFLVIIRFYVSIVYGVFYDTVP